MTKSIISTQESALPQGAYSQGVRAGGFLFIAGHTALDPETQKIVGNNIEEQTERALKNIQAVLQAADASLEDIVKTTVYLTNIDLFSRFNQTYEKYFPNTKPARATVEAKICGDGALIEIEAIAYLGN